MKRHCYHVASSILLKIPSWTVERAALVANKSRSVKMKALMGCGAIFLLGLCPHPSHAEAHILESQAPNVVSGAGNNLGIMMPVLNKGTGTVSSVMITDIDLPPADLTAPTTFPVNMGTIPAGGLFFIQATFNGALMHDRAKHLLTVHGTFEVEGVVQEFTIRNLVGIPGPPDFSLGVNKTDQLLLESLPSPSAKPTLPITLRSSHERVPEAHKAQALNGDVIDYFGAKDANGLATGFNSILFQSANGDMSRYNLDEQGRPLEVFLADGTTFTLVWSSATSVFVTAASADGTQHLAIPIDLSNQQSTNLAANFARRARPAMTERGFSGQPFGASFAGVPRLINAEASLTKFARRDRSETLSFRNCSLSSSSPLTSATGDTGNVDPTGQATLIQVDRCGPADNANVSLRYIPPQPFGGRVLPATLTAPGTGTYSVAMPTLGDEVTSFQNTCDAVAAGVGSWVCNGAQLSAAVCGFLAISGVGAPFVAECLIWVARVVTACEINGGGLAEGAPTIVQGFCSLVTNRLDLAAQGNVELRPVAQIPDVGTATGDLVEAPASGPFPGEGGLPPMIVSFPGTGPSIDSIQRITYNSPLIDALPSASFPRGGTYIAVIRGSCLSPAIGFQTDSQAVTGNLLSVYDTEAVVQISSAAVPENDTADSPIPSVSFTLPTSNGSISSGSVTLDVVAGSPPEVISFTITNGVTEVDAGTTTIIQYSAEILSSGNVQFFYVGCGLCELTFGQSSGDQFNYSLNWSDVATIPSDVPSGSYGMEVGAVDGAGQGGVLGSDPFSPNTISIPLINPSDPSAQARQLRSPAVSRVPTTAPKKFYVLPAPVSKAPPGAKTTRPKTLRPA